MSVKYGERRVAAFGRLFAAVATVLALSACATDVTEDWDEPASYTMRVTYDAYDAAAGTYRVMVRDHEVVLITLVERRGLLDEPADVDPQRFSMRQIVGRYQTALTHRDADESITFDTEGFPAQVRVDWDSSRPWDEEKWTITELRVSAP